MGDSQKPHLAKLALTPSLTQMIEQRTWENGQLRLELRRQWQKYRASMYVVAEARLVVENLQQAIANFQKLHAEVEGETGAVPTYSARS